MRYENRQPDEGINVTQVHPLSQFFQLAVGALVLVVLIVMLLSASGGWLAKRIPFSFELAIMRELDVDFGDNDVHSQMVDYLNELAQRVSSGMDLPADMQITVHYNSQDVFNAFATVGGNLVFYKGLLEMMPDENTLAMVMAHEIAHVQHRDPVASLGGGVASSLALLALTGNTGSQTASTLVQVGNITGMQFTRSMEEDADATALAALNALYGHVNGARQLFDLFSKARGSEELFPHFLESFLSTHPLDADRVEVIETRANGQSWFLQGELTALPDDFESWL